MLTFLMFVAFAIWVGYLISAVVAMVRRRPSGRRWLISLGGFVAFLVIGFNDPDMKQSQAANASVSHSDDQSQPAPVQSTSSVQDDKRNFLASVDHSISSARIAGNPYKFVGKHVQLRCTVNSVPQEDFFNADCGSDSDGMPVTIVIEADTKSLEQGQVVRILGTVEQPMEGNNAMGGNGSFPTVKAEFME